MLYMKEMRANVVAECTLKESAAINQILGRRVSSGTQLHVVGCGDCFIRTCPNALAREVILGCTGAITSHPGK